MASTSDLSVLSCDRCPSMFASWQLLDCHFRQVHNDVRSFMCHLCPARFASPAELEIHVESCPGKKSSNTQLTNAPAALTPKSLPSCPNTVNKPMVFICSNCSEKIPSPELLVSHLSVCKNKASTSSSSSISQPLKQVIRVPTSSVPVNSIFANLKSGTVISKQELNALLNSGNPALKNAKFLKREELNKVGNAPSIIRLPTPNPSSLNLSSGQVTPAIVSDSGKSASVSIPPSSASVSNPMNTGSSTSQSTPAPMSSEPTVLKPFKCKSSGCIQDFVSISDLNVHVNEHHQDTCSVSCSLCDMTFSSISELEEHVRSFVCPIEASGQWKGFGSMPSLPNGSLDIFDPSIASDIGGDVKLPDLSEFLELKLDKVENKLAGKVLDITPDPSTFILSDSSSESEPDDPVVLADQKRSRKFHVCNVCSKQYPTLHSFTKHYKKHTITAGNKHRPLQPQTHEKKLKFPCNVCEKSFDSFDKLFYHRKVHTGETPFCCKYCDMAFVDMIGLKYHMYACHSWALNDLKLIHCKEVKVTRSGPRGCPGKFFSIKCLRDHFLIVHRNEPGLKCFCDVCHQTFVGADAMEEHVSSKECDIAVRMNEWLSHVDFLPMDKLNDDFSQKKRTFTPVHVKNSAATAGKKRSLRVMMDSKTNCPRCKREFCDLTELECHYNNKCDGFGEFGRRNTRCAFKCKICSLSFARDEEFQQHMDLHCKSQNLYDSLAKSGTEQGERRSAFKKECNFCLQVFNDIGLFFEHYKTHGKPTKKKRGPMSALSKGLSDSSVCGENGVSTNDTASMNEEPKLMNNTRKDSQNDPFIALSQSKELKKPKLIWHASEKSETDSVLPSNRTLKLQKTCPICSSIFTDMNSFVEHYRLHYRGDSKASNRNNSFTCGHCNAAFISRQVYLNHMKIHSGETPFKCRYCNEACASQIDLGLHIPASHMKKKFFKIIDRGEPGQPERHYQITSVYELELTLGKLPNGRKRRNWWGKCLECGLTIESYKEMKIHILNGVCAVTLRPLIIDTFDSSLYRYLCKICGNLYEEARDLQSHILKTHTRTESDLL